MSLRLTAGIIIFLFLKTWQCAYAKKGSVLMQSDQIGLQVFVYPSGHFAAAKTSYDRLKNHLKDIFDTLGTKEKRGEVGLALVHPYLAWTEGKGSGPYRIPEEVIAFQRMFLKAASDFKSKVLVQFNGAVWHDPEDAKSGFIPFWKTVGGGKYLSRYNDGQVNESLKESGFIEPSKLFAFVNYSPYGPKPQDSLFFTLSPFATEFRNARLSALETAVKLWNTLDKEFPGVIHAFTTESEVCNFSFRKNADGTSIPLGYEDFNTQPFCKQNHIKDCKKFFSRKTMNYSRSKDFLWYVFRSQNHKQFLADSTRIIRKVFLEQPIYQHQQSFLDRDFVAKHQNHQDFASPQWTAFIPQSNPGFTFYTYEGDRYFTKRAVIREIAAKLNGRAWAMTEFNTARAFKGSKKQLADFTVQILELAYRHGLRVIAPLSWRSNSLDIGIKGSGVDVGIERFLKGRVNHQAIKTD